MMDDNYKLTEIIAKHDINHTHVLKLLTIPINQFFCRAILTCSLF